MFIVDSQVHIWREETQDRPGSPVPGSGCGSTGTAKMLASGLAANPIVPAYHSGTKEGRRHRQNAFLLAIGITAFVPLDEFKESAGQTVDAIKSLPAADETSQIPIPGERGRRSQAERRSSGIPLGLKVWRELTETATALGVQVPAPLG